MSRTGYSDRERRCGGRRPSDPPRVALDAWRLRAWGQVEREAEWNWDELSRLPSAERVVAVRCDSGRRLDGSRWHGVPTRELLSRVRLRPAAAFVVVHDCGGGLTGISLASFAAADALLAWSVDGESLTAERGWPLRLVVPRRGAPQCVKWVTGLEFLNKSWPATFDPAGTPPLP